MGGGLWTAAPVFSSSLGDSWQDSVLGNPSLGLAGLGSLEGGDGWGRTCHWPFLTFPKGPKGLDLGHLVAPLESRARHPRESINVY